LDAAAVDAAPDPCGILGTVWSRCALDPLVQAGFLQPDGRYEVAVGDPDVQYDSAARLWRAWWSTTLKTHYSDSGDQLGIKYAESADGVHWNVQPALTITSSTNPSDWDSSKLETPSVVYVPSRPAESRFLLYYSGAPPTEKVVNGGQIPWYQIGLAFSADGRSFTRVAAQDSPYGKAGLILQGGDVFPGLPGLADGSVADPEIVFDGATFHLLFSSVAIDAMNHALAFGISHASSTDGIHFTAAAGNPIASLVGGRGPSIVRDPDGTWEMFFQRDSATDAMQVPSTFNPQVGIWRATSSDLAQWIVPSSMRELVWDGSLATETYGWISAGDMALVDGEYRYYYSAFSTLTPPASDWVVPTHDGFHTSLIVLDLARRR
jgi:hypothetical protein